MTKNLLRKKDIIEKVGIAKSTVSDWIEDFKIYIPTVKRNTVTYYRPETLNVLLDIKKLRDQNYSKDQIHEILNDKGYPINVEKIKEEKNDLMFQDIQNDYLKYMELFGIALGQISDQDGRLKRYEHEVYGMKLIQDGQKERIEQQEETIIKLKDELEQIKQMVAVSNEKKWWQFWKS
ncbi:MerR family transcriptional regulator [Bacillus sp. FSL R12-0069]|uniref:MerR family transcriptional regulator n=1 Tax=Bacillus sp. FSL R12-0069 TaxID=2975342 RepID=UPI0030F8C2DC